MGLWNAENIIFSLFNFNLFFIDKNVKDKSNEA